MPEPGAHAVTGSGTPFDNLDFESREDAYSRSRLSNVDWVLVIGTSEFGGGAGNPRPGRLGSHGYASGPGGLAGECVSLVR